MAMIGKASGQYDPSALSKQDKMMLFGAMLRDTGAGLSGGQSDAVMSTQSMLAARQAEGRKRAFAAQLGQMLQPQYDESEPISVGRPGMIGGGATPGNAADYTYQPPQKTSEGLSINDPRMARLTMQAQESGYDMSKILDVMKAQQPDVRYDRGYGYNGKTGAPTGPFHADVGEGRTATLDAAGNPVGVSNLPGYVNSIAEVEGAKTGAQEKAKAPYNFETFQGPTGVPTVVSGATAAALGADGGVIARGQSAADASAAKIKADSQAGAQISLPQNMQAAQAALSLIGQIKGHSALTARTGMTGMLPAVPGTPGADFDAMASQLKGKVFLEAYATLKGAGAITENEGQAAREAIARLNTRQSESGYRAALGDLEKVIKAGADRSARQAGARPAGQTARPTRAAIEAEMRARGLLK